MDQSNQSRDPRSLLFLALTLVALVLGYAGYLYAHSYAKSVQAMNPRAFSVSGEGKIVVKNDIAQFTYSVISQGDKDISAVKQSSDAKINKIRAWLKDQGIDSKDIQTVIYNLEPRYQYANCGSPVGGGASVCPPPTIVGYTLNQTESIKIRDLAKVDSIVSGVVNAGANTVSQLNFTVDDQTALKNQAKGMAIKNALEQAKVIAKAGGFSVGDILSIDETSMPMPYDRMYGAGGMTKTLNLAVESAPAAPDTSVEAGSNEIISNVMVRFEIK